MDSDALIFDLDGTLIDSLPDLQGALNGMLDGLSRRRLSAAEVRGMIGDGTPFLVKRALAATGGVIDIEEAHQRFLQLYENRLARESQLYPGVAETLSAFRADGVRLGVCTNKQQVPTLAVLKAFGIADYFSVIVGGDAVPLRKPNPAHLLAVMEKLGVAGSDAVMVGDNENDYAVARAVGVPVILMRYGYLRVPPESLSPDAWLDDFAAIPQTVRRIRGGRTA
jgi:phosphoglycolate phosphatase